MVRSSCREESWDETQFLTIHFGCDIYFCSRNRGRCSLMFSLIFFIFLTIQKYTTRSENEDKNGHQNCRSQFCSLISHFFHACQFCAELLVYCMLNVCVLLHHFHDCNTGSSSSYLLSIYVCRWWCSFQRGNCFHCIICTR